MPTHKKEPRRTKRALRSDAETRSASFVHRRLPAWLTAVGLAVALCAVYGPSLDVPFIFDDYSAIIKNESIKSLWPLIGEDGDRAPLNPEHHMPTSARPVANLSLALNYYFGGLNPAGYHAFSITVHFLSAMLLWAIVRRTLRLPYFGGRFEGAADWLASAVAILWALHPLQTESVIYATQRTELLMALFYLAVLYCSLRYWACEPLEEEVGSDFADDELNSTRRRHRALWLILATLAALAGMGSKEIMASAPVLVLLFERQFVAGSLGKALRASWPLYVALACGWFLTAWLIWDSPHSDSCGFHLGVPAHAWWFTQAKVLLLYLKLALWPWPLLIHYQLPYLNTVAAAWMYLLPVAVLGLGSLYLLWRNHPVGFLGTWMFAILSPTLLVPIVSEMAAERRMYLALAPLVILVVVGGFTLLQWWQSRKATVAAPSLAGRQALLPVAVPVGVVAAIYCLVSSARLASYGDEMTLWQEVERRQPQNYMAQENIGVQLHKAGHLEEAMQRFHQAIRLNPESVSAYYNLGLALLKVGRPDDAIAPFRTAVRLKPQSEIFLNNLAVALRSANRVDEAIDVFHEALKIKPTMWRAHDNLGEALHEKRDYEGAIRHFERAIEINPQELGIYGRLADAYARANRADKAIATAEQAWKMAHSAGKFSTASKIAAQLTHYRASLVESKVQPRPPLEGKSSSN